MTTVHVIDSENIFLYSGIMEEYFAMRHQIFVGELGWNNLRSQRLREIDAYDNEAATYLLALDRGRVVGGQRLYPAAKPHMLSEVFPHLVEGKPALPTATLEWTRYFVAKERRFGRTDCRMLAAVQRHCLDQGVHTLLAVVEMWWLPRWQHAGFQATPLGLPHPIGGVPCIAVSVKVSRAALASVNRLGGLADDPLVRDGPDRAPFRTDRLGKHQGGKPTIKTSANECVLQ